MLLQLQKCQLIAQTNTHRAYCRRIFGWRVWGRSKRSQRKFCGTIYWRDGNDESWYRHWSDLNEEIEIGFGIKVERISTRLTIGKNLIAMQSKTKSFMRQRNSFSAGISCSTLCDMARKQGFNEKSTNRRSVDPIRNRAGCMEKIKLKHVHPIFAKSYLLLLKLIST